jgi:uncharacterized protein YndB with AHSA1/START domain
MSTSQNTVGNEAAKRDILVRKSITVAAPAERAFQVFTKEMTSWWPLGSHHIGKADAKEAVMEPFVGGRWFERGVDGSECDWGHVRVWDPPRRLVLSWEISADWKADASIQSEVEVRFTAEGSGTRVDLEHRRLDQFGARAEEMRGVLDSEGGWTSLLGSFAARAAAT